MELVTDWKTVNISSSGSKKKNLIGLLMMKIMQIIKKRKMTMKTKKMLKKKI
jgi:hypothetical protein